MSVAVRILPGLTRSSGRAKNSRSPGYTPKGGKQGTIEKSLAKTGRNKGARYERPVRKRGVRRDGPPVWATLAKLITLGLIAVSLAAVSVGLLAGYRWITSLNYFAVQGIEITGIERLKAPQVLALAGIEEGQNILAINIGKVEAALSRHPWVGAVSVRRILPRQIKIAIGERAPTYWMQYQDNLYYADADGRIIDKIEADKFESLPQLEVEAGMEKHLGLLRELARVGAEGGLPFSMDKVAWLRLSWGSGLEVRLLDRDLTVCLAVDNFRQSVSRLSIVWADLVRRGELDQSRVVSSLSDKVWVEKKGN
ncbi:MAG: FtsQ-type POTRA domain-containing protein [Desulfovibrionaceae bacterium]|nr:FtsQ-type POTRA domain-containing protein [Desulfovibrionaceae bacterium]MBF0514468.1 FtsQ-type POTRA domain-containing protein [Desulfovibrionaceae bacterium]